MVNGEREIGQTISGKPAAPARFFTVFAAALKPIGLFAGGLYLFGFGLYGLNRFGLVDALIPYERVGCLVLGVAFLAWFALSMVRFWKLIRSY